MHDMGTTIYELHAMLKLVEKCIPKKAPAVIAIRQGQIQKPKRKHEARERIEAMARTVYWKRNCPLYLAELKKNKANASGTSGVRGYQKLNKGALDLGVISLSRLWDNGFRHKFMDNGAISVSKDNIFYFNVFPCYGIFEIDMYNHISNEHSIYTCSNKKSKHNLDSTFLWHCRLGHINKKRIKKLQHDRLLKSINDESFNVCVSCISGKMERKPFTHASERADDLLGIIHSDVCGPFRTTSREAERRNRTLLDMVRSMISLTTLPMSFWGYALEFDARILNMVPTKKVNKTPYEMWHGKVLNLSYLKVWGCEALTNLIKQEASGSTVDFDKIQREDAQPFKNTSQHQHKVKHDAVDTQTNVIPVCRSARIPQAPERYSFYIDAEEHKLGDHGILIAIAAYYDYEICQMDVKTAFLNGRLNEDVYMVQPEGFVNPKHPGRITNYLRYDFAMRYLKVIFLTMPRGILL
ncbi:zinc finger, CCHC-type containing protein [Tanacetum coccineum]